MNLFFSVFYLFTKSSMYANMSWVTHALVKDYFYGKYQNDMQRVILIWQYSQ